MNKKPKKNTIRELAEELDVFDDMLSVLVDLLETKGVITRKEFEDSLKAKIEKTSRFKSYRDI
jgi:DNA-binding MarR family transcriptional regulator